MNKDFFDFSDPDARLGHELTSTAEKVFQIMENNGLIAVPERKAFMFAAWPRGLYPFPWIKTVIGTTFDPKLGFDENCNRFVEEKPTRQFENNHTCSAASRKPEMNQWEGSISVIIRGIEWAFSVSGLKGREDQAISIMTPCIILPEEFNLETPRIAKILDICEGFEDLKGITEYTYSVYDAVASTLAF